jgi:hypothetical protein
VRTLFSDQLTAETAFNNCSELLNVVLNVVAAELSFALSEEFHHSAAAAAAAESAAATAAPWRDSKSTFAFGRVGGGGGGEGGDKANTRKTGFRQLAIPPPPFLTGQTVGELYQETVLFVCSRNKAGSNAVENAEEAEEILQLSKQ